MISSPPKALNGAAPHAWCLCRAPTVSLTVPHRPKE